MAISYAEVPAQRVLGVELDVFFEVLQRIWKLLLEKECLATGKISIRIRRVSFYALFKVLDGVLTFSKSLVGDRQEHKCLLTEFNFMRLIQVFRLNHAPELADSLL